MITFTNIQNEMQLRLQSGDRWAHADTIGVKTWLNVTRLWLRCERQISERDVPCRAKNKFARW
jgi:hypothetical protein